MEISRVAYYAKDKAASTPDGISLTVNLISKGNVVATVQFAGLSNEINGQIRNILPLDADRMEVTAFDLDFESHYIVLGDKEFHIPRTAGEKTYKYSLDKSSTALLYAIGIGTVLLVLAIKKRKQG